MTARPRLSVIIPAKDEAPRIKATVVSLATNQGKGAAVRHGVVAAQSAGAAAGCSAGRGSTASPSTSSCSPSLRVLGIEVCDVPVRLVSDDVSTVRVLPAAVKMMGDLVRIRRWMRRGVYAVMEDAEANPGDR